MLTEAEKRDFFLSTTRPMSGYTLPYLTQVVGVLDDRRGEALGTGFFCEFGGRQAVVTAAHVLRKASATGRYSSLMFTRGSGESPAIVRGKIRYFEDLDLAIYLPSVEFPIGPDKSFWPEGQIERDAHRAKTDYLFAQGFPLRFARSSASLGGLVSETLSSGAMMRLVSPDNPAEEAGKNDLPEGLLGDHQFAFDFDFDVGNFEGPDGTTSSNVADDWREVFNPGERDTLQGQRPRGAHGLSGSPVWRIGASDGLIRDWMPRSSKLVGIVTHWNPDHKVLIATSAAKLLEVSPYL